MVVPDEAHNFGLYIVIVVYSTITRRTCVCIAHSVICRDNLDLGRSMHMDIYKQKADGCQVLSIKKYSKK